MSEPTRRVRPDYLRAVGSDIDVVVRLIVHDLVSTGALKEADAEELAMSRGVDFTDASAGGIDYDAADTALWIAEAVQEDMIEGHDGLPRMVTWPACPDHPAHPLWLKRSGEDDPNTDQADWHDPAWTCTRTGVVIAELGEL